MVPFPMLKVTFKAKKHSEGNFWSVHFFSPAGQKSITIRKPRHLPSSESWTHRAHRFGISHSRGLQNCNAFSYTFWRPRWCACNRYSCRDRFRLTPPPDSAECICRIQHLKNADNMHGDPCKVLGSAALEYGPPPIPCASPCPEAL